MPMSARSWVSGLVKYMWSVCVSVFRGRAWFIIPDTGSRITPRIAVNQTTRFSDVTFILKGCVTYPLP